MQHRHRLYAGQQERALRIAHQMAPGPVDGHRRLEQSWGPAIRAHVRFAGWAAGCDRTEFHLAARSDLHVRASAGRPAARSEEHTSELQSLRHLVCRLLLEKKNESIASFTSLY